MKRLKLSVIADALEETMDGWEQFYNTDTGEVESIPVDNGLADMDVFAETAERIENSRAYVRIPNQYEIHEYEIMMSFAKYKKSDNLCSILNQPKPYRHFKTAIIRLRCEREYYAFRHSAYIGIVRDWCKDHGIPYTM